MGFEDMKITVQHVHDEVMTQQSRTRLYKAGQIRLQNDGKRIIGPVLLKARIGNRQRVDPHKKGWGSDESVWEVESLICDAKFRVGEFNLGMELTEMEALAWASK